MSVLERTDAATPAPSPDRPVLAVAEDHVAKCRAAELEAVAVLPSFDVIWERMGLKMTRSRWDMGMRRSMTRMSSDSVSRSGRILW